MTLARKRWRNCLPHWESIDRPHFITIHCPNSSPNEARIKITEIHASLRSIAPNSPHFAVQQKQYFLLSEKYLDHAEGHLPFLNQKVCEIVATDWVKVETQDGWQIPHFVIMPNHFHFLMTPLPASLKPLRTCLRQFKGRAARMANQIFDRNGAFWQTDWLDRCVGDEAETARVVGYMHLNPVKAGLANCWQNYPWVR